MEQNWKDINYVMEAVKKDGMLIVNASSILKSDIDVVKEAVKNNKNAIEYADPYIQNMFGYKGKDLEDFTSEKLLKCLEVRLAARSIMLSKNTCATERQQEQALGMRR